MELHQLRCFIVVAQELHFGHAAQQMNMLPSALGRYIKLLEEELGTRLLSRSTRNVSLTPHGKIFLEEAQRIVTLSDELLERFQNISRINAGRLRIGAIDSAAVGLIPHILHIFCDNNPGIEIQIMEDKTTKLLPRLKSGRLDLIFIRPMEQMDESLETYFLFYEDIVLAVADTHKLATLKEIHIDNLLDVPLIVPERKIRPHSHDLTLKLFEHTTFKPRLIQMADEKQTIINMVAADLGAAIMPRWVSRMSIPHVKFIPLAKEYENIRKKLPIAAVWIKDSRDEARDKMLVILKNELAKIAEAY
ncbi:LysR family transcriptional regulator [Acerihabitans arboris]|uniref:LysR family transcriptional regulator n=1 Tax=Acerihabitans arboris TaxID=2691583 RepID=A0A845SP28_9GAMM|nr:LysR family transcriptional regulator [Acerihabitans arboris]NDL65829.1 LysR family transcriptional regulator [Acerihabitans arboris]